MGHVAIEHRLVAPILSLLRIGVLEDDMDVSITSWVVVKMLAEQRYIKLQNGVKINQPQYLRIHLLLVQLRFVPLRNIILSLKDVTWC